MQFLQPSKFWGRIFSVPGIFFIVCGALSHTPDVIRAGYDDISGIYVMFGGVLLVGVGLLVNEGQKRVFGKHSI